MLCIIFILKLFKLLYTIDKSILIYIYPSLKAYFELILLFVIKDILSGDNFLRYIIMFNYSSFNTFI
jgi:hypothetical protein